MAVAASLAAFEVVVLWSAVAALLLVVVAALVRKNSVDLAGLVQRSYPCPNHSL